MIPSDSDLALRSARSFAEQGNASQAEAAYQRVLQGAPENTEALRFLGARALAIGDHERAAQLLGSALKGEPEDPALLKNLGVACLQSNRLEEARDHLAHSLNITPDFFIARLFLAYTLEHLGEGHAALVNYFGAITQAQAKGRWLSEDTTAHAVRELVKHAMAFVNAGRRQLFGDVLAPYTQKYGEDALRRTQHCLQIYLGDAAANYVDPRQKPLFLYFPELPTTPYFDQSLFPWTAELERNTDIIRNELLEVLRDEKGIEPFLKFDSEADIPKYLAGAGGKPAWDAFFFYRHGVRYEENCKRCPRTTAILDASPLVHIREHAPEICFSVLTPGTHILPHRGVTNIRLVTHLPLIVPPNCALSVGGEVHEWQAGKCVTFDDTFEHEAWNRGDETRVVLITDCWNPHLTQVEREAVNDLVQAIGDFNREAAVPSRT